MVSPDSHFSVKRVEMVKGLDSVDRGQNKVNDFLVRSRSGYLHDFLTFAFSKLKLYCVHIYNSVVPNKTKGNNFYQKEDHTPNSGL